MNKASRSLALTQLLDQPLHVRSKTTRVSSPAASRCRTPRPDSAPPRAWRKTPHALPSKLGHPWLHPQRESCTSSLTRIADRWSTRRNPGSLVRLITAKHDWSSSSLRRPGTQRTCKRPNQGRTWHDQSRSGKKSRISILPDIGEGQNLSGRPKRD